MKSTQDRTASTKPAWLRKTLPIGAPYESVSRLLTTGGVHTVCREARCPNQWECFARKTATFLILGPRCTRNCAFCAVEPGAPLPPDPAEPERVARTAHRLGLRYVVITSVTRDDLSDGGASAFARTIEALKKAIPRIRVEVLVPDFGGNVEALEVVLRARPDVLNHNIETVPRLYPEVRSRASYERSIRLLCQTRKLAPPVWIKSGLMLGLGETEREVEQVLHDLFDAGCRILTLGQYLRPSPRHFPVHRYVPPEEFEEWRRKALSMGFRHVASGPFVRSSYKAEELFRNLASEDAEDLS